eukprot:Em0015g908a
MQRTVATITFETSEYLAKTPCVNQNPQVIEGFLKALAPYKLSSFEKLQLLNIRPTSLVELHLVIEDMDERLGEERVGQLWTLLLSVACPGPGNYGNPVIQYSS